MTGKSIYSQRLGIRYPRGWTWAVTLVLGAGVALLSLPASALNFRLGPDSNLNWTTAFKYAASYRTDSPNEKILANPNTDDGDRAFASGLFVNEITALTALSFTYKNFGAFVRADALFNMAYEDNSENLTHLAVDPNPFPDNTPGNPSYEFVNETLEHHRSRVRLLDAFVYGNFTPFDTFMTVTVGRQVISWGESLFLGGIGAVQNPIDIAKAHKPAVEIKTLYLPQGAVQLQWKLTRNLSVAGYYRWQWTRSKLDSTGSYFSGADFLAGGEVFYAPIVANPTFSASDYAPVPYGGRIQPDDGDQYGVNIHYTVPALNYADFGLYYLHYNAKLPQVVFKGGKYYAKYFGDIDLYGVSVSSTFLQYFTLGFEYSYRDGRPVPAYTKTGGSLVSAGPARADVGNYLLNSIFHSPISLLWSGTTTLSVGVGYNKLYDFEKEGLQVKKDDDGATYTASLALAYPNIMPLLSMTITPSISKGFYHDSAVRAAYNSGNTSLGLSVAFQYLAKWDFGVSYVMFRGSPAENGLTDRDFVNAHIKYTF